MGLTATEITTSTAGKFDVELVFYGNMTYSALTLSDYVTGDSTPPTAGWTNLTAYIRDSGSLTYERAGNSLRWTANISGHTYSETYFGPGKAIMCLRRILINEIQVWPSSGTYELWWVGQILSGQHEDDYKHGLPWSRSISGLDSLLGRSTAPRFTAGRVNLLTNASVSASSTLATPASEAGTGEFAGTLVTVAAGNTNDGNLNTLWISADTPSLTARAVGTGYFEKVFIKPLTGYDQAKTWWIEFLNTGLMGPGSGGWYLETSAGLFIYLTDELPIVAGDSVILAASQPEFEEYTGGARNGVLVIDAKTVSRQGTSIYVAWGARDGTFTLNPSADWIKLRQMVSAGFAGTVRDTIAWNQDGATVTQTGWTGAGIDVSDDLCPPGSGIRRKAGETSGSAAKYEFTDLLIPGDDYEEDEPEWLLYSLEEQPAALDGNVSAGATIITLTSTLGLLDYGEAICEGDHFYYSARSPTTLTGVSLIGNHSSGAAVKQVIGGVEQTGWPCNQVEVLRPANTALAGITNGRIYFRKTGLTPPKTPDDDDWELDYDESVVLMRAALAGDDIRDYGCVLTAADGGPRWIAHMLIVIDSMSDGGRAKLNEARLSLAQTQIDNSGLGDIDSLAASALAKYIFAQAGTTTTLSGDTPGKLIGEHATAIAPYPQVLDDLARITGCLIDWSLAGTPTWRDDVWWPGTLTSFTIGTTQGNQRARLDATYLRGKAQYSGHKPNEGGIKIHARTPDGLHTYEAQFPQTTGAGVQFIEYNDLIVSSVLMARRIAETLYYKNGLHYSAGAQEMTFTLKGPGEWLAPDQWITLACHNTTGETAIVPFPLSGYGTWDDVAWLTESVTWKWGRSDAFRTWSATARCRRYWQ